MLQTIKKKVLCKKVTKEKKTEGGIYLPDNSKEDSVILEVLSKGGEVTDEICVGDKVVVSGFQGADVKHSGEDYIVLEEKQILAVIS